MKLKHEYKYVNSLRVTLHTTVLSHTFQPVHHSFELSSAHLLQANKAQKSGESKHCLGQDQQVQLNTDVQTCPKCEQCTL